MLFWKNWKEEIFWGIFDKTIIFYENIFYNWFWIEINLIFMYQKQFNFSLFKFFITYFESKSIWFLCIKSNSILACLKLFFCALFEQVINWSKELIYEFNLNRASLRLFILFIVYHISGWHFKHFVFCFRFFFNFKIKSSFSLLCKRVLSLYNVHWLISANKF